MFKLDSAKWLSHKNSNNIHVAIRFHRPMWPVFCARYFTPATPALNRSSCTFHCSHARTIVKLFRGRVVDHVRHHTEDNRLLPFPVPAVN